MSSPSPKLEFVSTVDASCRGSLRDVLLSAIPAKGGLWVPTHIPQIAPDFVERHRDASYADLAEAVIAPYFAEVLGPAVLRQLCQEAFNFPVPLVHPEGFKGTPAERIAVIGGVGRIGRRQRRHHFGADARRVVGKETHAPDWRRGGR